MPLAGKYANLSIEGSMSPEYGMDFDTEEVGRLLSHTKLLHYDMYTVCKNQYSKYLLLQSIPLLEHSR